KGLTIVSYYGRLKQIWDELENFDQVTTCTRGKCKCDLEKNLAKKQEDEKVHTFLMGLDENVYGTTRSNSLAKDHLPNMNKVYSTLIQEEQVKTMTRAKADRPKIMALAVQNQTKIKNDSLSYTHCHKASHTEETCFEINRYPKLWGERPRVDRKGGIYEKGTSTGRGKVRGSCGSTRANTIQAGGGIGANTGTSDSNVIPLFGASHHMTGMIEELFNLKEIVQCTDELPDGNIATAKKKGDFAPNICVIQHLTSRTVIGAVKERMKDSFTFERGQQIECSRQQQQHLFLLIFGINVRDNDILSSPQSLNVDSEEQIQEEKLGRGHRKKETSVRLSDYVTNTVKKYSQESTSCKLGPYEISYIQLVLKVVLLCLTKRTMCHGRLVFFGDANREITVTETFHLQTDDELSDKELKQIEADDQAIQTILLGLPEDIYAAVDSYETAQKFWLRVQQMMKGSNIRIQEKKAKQMQMVRGNGGNQFRQYTRQNAGNPAGYNDVIRNQVIQNAVQNLRVQIIGNQNARAEGNAAGKNGNQIRCYNCRGTRLLIAHKEEAGIQPQAEEYDLMAVAADLDEIEKVNANCILLANL
nr:hypothetical protein [Tanacetum cinerariifolium]